MAMFLPREKIFNHTLRGEIIPESQAFHLRPPAMLNVRQHSQALGGQSPAVNTMTAMHVVPVKSGPRPLRFAEDKFIGMWNFRLSHCFDSVSRIRGTHRSLMAGRLMVRPRRKSISIHPKTVPALFRLSETRCGQCAISTRKASGNEDRCDSGRQAKKLCCSGMQPANKKTPASRGCRRCENQHGGD